MSARRQQAAGAVTAQFSQAAVSFLLTVVGLRSLPATEFGVFSLLIGTLVLATALMTGFVGDSLTVLDRHDRRIRAGIELWCLLIGAGLLVVGAVATSVTGLLSLGDALLFGLALTAFTVEDTARRLLMANLRFWSVVVTDLVYLVGASAVLLVLWKGTGRITLGDLLLALVLSQVAATVVGVALAPRGERYLVGLREPALAAVARFGGWRALQQGLRPGTLTVMRIVVLAVAGDAALGRLEAARVYMSPALLLVQGFGGFLLATYSADRHLPLPRAIRAATRTVWLLVGTSLVLGVIAYLLLPVAGDWLTGGAFEIPPAAVLSWAAFAAAVAATMPYASLGAVRGRQVVVVGLRVVDSLLCILFVVLALQVAGVSYVYAPLAVAAGATIGAILQRTVGLGRRAILPVERVGAEPL